MRSPRNRAASDSHRPVAITRQASRQEILERASPQRHGGRLAQNVGDLFCVDAGIATRDVQVSVPDASKCLAPFIAPQELHQIRE